MSDLQSAANGVAAPLKIAIFARNLGAVGHLRLLDPLRFLGHDVQYAFTEIRPGVVTIRPGIEHWADILVVQRDFPGPDTAPVCKNLLSCAKPTVYETDDIVWEFASPNAKPHILEFISSADLVTVSTAVLAQKISAWAAQPLVLPNALNDRLWRPHAIDPLQRRSRRVRIGYAGMPDHFHDINDLRGVLLKVAAAHRQVDLVFLGCQPNAMDEARHVSFAPPVLDYSLFPQALSALNLDIGLAPLRHTSINACRSAVKFFDHALTGTVTVASRGHVFDTVIRNGENGYLCGTADEWFSVLSQLVCDARLRKRLARAAQTEVLERHMLSQNAALWNTAYQALKPQRSAGAPENPNTRSDSRG